MPKWIGLVLILFFLCFFSTFIDNQMEKISPSEMAINSVVKKTADELEKKYGLKLDGIGGSGDFGKITTEYMGLSISKKFIKDQARELIIECCQIFLTNINEDQNLTQFLSEVPFTYKKIEVAIVFYNTDRSFIYHPGLTVVAFKEGKLIYYTNDPDHKYRFKSITEETYEEAHQKIKLNKFVNRI